MEFIKVDNQEAVNIGCTEKYKRVAVRLQFNAHIGEGVDELTVRAGEAGM